MAIPNVLGQQYRLDWAGSQDPDQVNESLARLWSNTDEMVQTLFDDLNHTIDAINATNALGLTAPQVAARVSLRV